MSNELIEQRMKKVEVLRSKGIEPYPYIFKRTCDSSQFMSLFAYLEPGDVLEKEKVSMAGRVMAMRVHGKSLFFVLQDFSGRFQCYIRINVGKEKYELFKENVDIGDFIGVKGYPFRSHTGELTVYVEKYHLLSKAIRTLPEKWHGLQNVEKRYRERYVDLIVNEDARDILLKRIKIVKAIRDYLDSLGFLEVETPILQSVYGGASAKPFKTYLNALDMDMYLRIAPELYLKRLIVGGFEKIYEIGRCFRNEGISYKHNPEFTSVELYQAYADYNDMMELTENLVCEVARKVIGKTKVEYQGVQIDLTPPWRRIGVADMIKKRLGIDILNVSDEELKQEFIKHGIETQKLYNRGKMIEKLIDLLEDELVQPAFLIDHPMSMSPLAKKHRKYDGLTERFELFICGQELANAFSELNDPIDQRERFSRQMEFRKAGDEEAQVMDEDFVHALEYGMPPTGGLGIGIDRLAMILTDAKTIKDVILFPTLKRSDNGDSHRGTETQRKQ